MMSTTEVLLPFVCPPGSTNGLSFSRDNLNAFYTSLKQHDVDMSKQICGDDSLAVQFALKRGNPTGCAAGHSGDRWLKDMVGKFENDGPQYVAAHRCDFEHFFNHVQQLVPALRGPRSCRGTVDQLWDAINSCAAPHSGAYYRMQIFRAVRHGYDISKPGRTTRFPACACSELLWDNLLLQHDGGAKKGAELLGMHDWRAAAQLVERIQFVCPSFCMCDLACWLCLGKANIPPPAKRRRCH